MLNFSLNLFIMLAAPILLIYLAIVFNVIQYPGVKWSVYGLFFLGITLGSYASSIVRAFFAYFRQEIYDSINHQKTVNN